MIRINARRIVHCDARIPLPMPLSTAWGQVRDFHRFAAQDYFHARFQIDGGIPQAGASLIIEHQFAWFKAVRRGRILRWRENDGYAFSDLSMRGNAVGFPHVLALRLEWRSSTSSFLHVTVRGRWTARVPRWIAWLWLHWVFGHATRSIENQLLGFALFRRRRLSATIS